MHGSIIAIAVVIAVTVFWIISTQRSLAWMDENINNVMNQTGILLSSWLDALTALLDLTNDYTNGESEALAETIKSHRWVVTEKSTTDNVLRQEGIIMEALAIIDMVAEQYPELKENVNFAKALDAVYQYENIVNTSRLIYNDSVTKYNRAIRMFPVSMIAGLLGFHKRDYLEYMEQKYDMTGLKY